MALVTTEERKEFFGTVDYQTLALCDFAEWAVAKRLSIPPEMAAMAPGEISDGLLAEVLNEANQHHAPELAIAIRAWLAVAVDGQGNARDTIKNRIAGHLEKQHLSKKAIERISSVCTPATRKKGGR